MNDEFQQRYLQEVLALDARSMADLLVRRRREFLALNDGVFEAELAGKEDGVDLRTILMYRLNDLRSRFWTLEADQLAGELKSLTNVEHVETRVAASRLERVAAVRDSVNRLSTDPAAHQAFVNTFAQVLIASPSESNQLKEREHQWMRPERNEQFWSARQAIFGTALLMREKYPELFALEESWLNELLEYDPKGETVDETANSMLGLVILGEIVVTLLIVVGSVVWIFS